MKRKTKKKSEPTWQKFYYIFLFMLIIDGAVSTPLTLYYVPNSYEANPVHAFYYDKIGLIYFFISPILTGLMLYFFFAGIDLKMYEWKKVRWPTIAVIVSLTVVEFIVTINNFYIFFSA